MILNVHWYQRVTNEVLYGAIEKVSTKIRRRCLKFSGHCLLRDDEVISDLVLWEPLFTLIIIIVPLLTIKIQYNIGSIYDRKHKW